MQFLHEREGLPNTPLQQDVARTYGVGHAGHVSPPFLLSLSGEVLRIPPFVWVQLLISAPVRRWRPGTSIAFVPQSCVVLPIAWVGDNGDGGGGTCGMLSPPQVCAGTADVFAAAEPRKCAKPLKRRHLVVHNASCAATLCGSAVANMSPVPLQRCGSLVCGSPKHRSAAPAAAAIAFAAAIAVANSQIGSTSSIAPAPAPAAERGLGPAILARRAPRRLIFAAAVRACCNWTARVAQLAGSLAFETVTSRARGCLRTRRLKLHQTIQRTPKYFVANSAASVHLHLLAARLAAACTTRLGFCASAPSPLRVRLRLRLFLTPVASLPRAACCCCCCCFWIIN